MGEFDATIRFLALTYNQPEKRFQTLVDYFSSEPPENLKTALKQHIENDTRIPTIAHITAILRERQAALRFTQAKDRQENYEQQPWLAEFVSEFIAQSGHAKRRHLVATATLWGGAEPIYSRVLLRGAPPRNTQIARPIGVGPA